MVAKDIVEFVEEMTTVHLLAGMNLGHSREAIVKEESPSTGEQGNSVPETSGDVVPRLADAKPVEDIASTPKRTIGPNDHGRIWKPVSPRTL